MRRYLKIALYAAGALAIAWAALFAGAYVAIVTDNTSEVTAVPFDVRDDGLAEIELPEDEIPTLQVDSIAQQPTSTDTPEPSPTLLLTFTPSPTPTAVPSSTARPTSTPRPTTTESPTRTPGPTATSIPTLTPTSLPSPTSLPPTITPVPPTPPLPTATTSSDEVATVTAVIDGDTIEVNLNGDIWRVRYIGIDTPEAGEVCGPQATQANAALVSGRTVRMVRDVNNTDSFGRLLRYVYVGSTFVNGQLVADGWAEAREYPPDTAMSSVLSSLAAQGAGQGCALVSQPQPTSPPSRGPEPITGGENCDPSYPTVCIPPSPPDLDCGDIPFRRFTVLPPDPHRFDGDNDGIGCESG